MIKKNMLFIGMLGFQSLFFYQALGYEIGAFVLYQSESSFPPCLAVIIEREPHVVIQRIDHFSSFLLPIKKRLFMPELVQIKKATPFDVYQLTKAYGLATPFYNKKSLQIARFERVSYLRPDHQLLPLEAGFLPYYDDQFLYLFKGITQEDLLSIKEVGLKRFFEVKNSVSEQSTSDALENRFADPRFQLFTRNVYIAYYFSSLVEQSISPVMSCCQDRLILMLQIPLDKTIDLNLTYLSNSVSDEWGIAVTDIPLEWIYYIDSSHLLNDVFPQDLPLSDKFHLDSQMDIIYKDDVLKGFIPNNALCDKFYAPVLRKDLEYIPLHVLIEMKSLSLGKPYIDAIKLKKRNQRKHDFYKKAQALFLLKKKFFYSLKETDHAMIKKSAHPLWNDCHMQ